MIINNIDKIKSKEMYNLRFARNLDKNKNGTTLVLQLKNRLYYFVGDRVYFLSLSLHNIII
ncbi:MAG: hypothetical protein EGQ00_08755 [Parabacteroides johnsonii]|nr:hypothetical protein [Parabacteroides johnsonii]